MERKPQFPFSDRRKSAHPLKGMVIRMQRRTDLALEAAEQVPDWQSLSERDIRQEKWEREGAAVTKIQIGSQRGAQAIGKPQGTYVTVEVPPLTDNEDQLEGLARLIGEQLAALLPKRGTVLVVGLGNEAITPDALGPKAAKMVLATRHIQGEFARAAGLEDLRPTAVMAPGVLGHTGVESGEMAKGISTVVHPAAVVAIDALAARSLSRLGCTVQLCDTGISPGAGVGNNRKQLSADTLGVPVIAVGVPTVVDAATLAAELTGREDLEPTVSPRGADMIVTPREIDLMILRASKLVAMAVNVALQPSYSPLELVTVAQ